MIWGIIALLAVIILIVVIFLILRNIIVLVINSIIGFFALVGFNYLFDSNVQINFWSVLITVIGGIFGFAIVLLSHFLGWAF